jgi:hypothetical protein
MKRFIDAAGRHWAVDINVTQIKRVRDLLKVDLFKLIDDGLRPLAELLSDPVGLVDVVYVLIQDQAKAQGVSDEDFGRAMAGDAIQAAAEAFTEELFDFFPETKDRLLLRKVLGKTREIAEVLAQENHQAIDTLIPAEEARRIISVRRAVTGRNGSSGAAPASSGLTQGPGDSAS